MINLIYFNVELFNFYVLNNVTSPVEDKKIFYNFIYLSLNYVMAQKSCLLIATPFTDNYNILYFIGNIYMFLYKLYRLYFY